MKRLYIFLCLLTMCTGKMYAQWSLANLSQSRVSMGAASAGNKVLFVGGVNGSGQSNVVDIYDNSTGTWTTSSVSQVREGIAAVSVGTKALFAGGFSGGVWYNNVDIYDAGTNTWTTAALSQGRSNLAGATLGTKVFFAGGYYYNGVTTVYSNVVDIYDNSTGVWTTATLSVGRQALSAAVVGTKIIFAGGISTGNPLNTVDIYDSSTNAWTTATLSSGRTSIGAGSLGTKAYFAGGYNSGSVSNVIDVYDASTNSWSTTTLSQARSGTGVASSGSKIIFAGGNAGNDVTTVDIYDSNTNSWTTSALSLARSNPAGASVGNKLFFAGGYLTTANSFTNAVDIYNLPPVITGFAPASGPVGTSVIISGTSFSSTPANNVVYFGAVKATVTAATATSLTVTVPTGASYHSIMVTVNGLTASSTKSFIPTFSSSTVINTNSFVSKIDFATSTQPHTVVVADFDLDGKPDLVVSNEISNSISVFRNTSTAGSVTASSFATKVDFTTGNTPRDISVDDLDRDGKLDIVVLQGSGFSVFRNTSSVGVMNAGSFSAKVDIASSSTNGVAIGDLDQDGRPDIALRGTNVVSVFRNISTVGSISISSFTAGVDFTSALTSNPSEVEITDIDGDNIQDLISVNNTSISIFRNKGIVGAITSGSFATKVDFTTGSYSSGLAIGDIDGDGKSDVATASNIDGIVSVLRNTSTTGAVSFEGKIDITQYAVHSLAIGDIDGDAKPDLAYGILGSQGLSNIYVAKNISSAGALSTSSFSTPVIFSSGGYPNCISISDVDGDGKADMLVTDRPSSNNVSVFRNQVLPPVTVTGFAPTSAAVGTSVTINGTNFDPTPVVKFNGAPATVTASTATTITVTVPSNASSGTISVTTSSQTITSASSFTVIPPPTITSFAPASGIVGSSVTITGTNFDTTPANNIVKFNGITAIVTASTSTSITTTVPTTATTGTIVITVSGQTVTSSTNFTVLLPPTITLFAPTSGVVGVTVTITGTNFSSTPADNTVKFNGTTATVTASTSTSITTTVPTGTTTGTISVEVSGQTVTSTTSFIVTTASSPTITSFNPGNGFIGASVTITGTNFVATPANNVVKFNGTTAVVIAASATSITTTVPAAATTGKITVTVGGQTATSATDFTVSTASTSVQIASSVLPTTYDKGSALAVSITVNDATKVSAVTLKSRGISEAASALKSVAVTASGNKFEKVIAATDLTDPIGLVYYFEVTDQSQGIVKSDVTKAIVKYPAASADQVIPNLSFGSTASNYQIIAIPLELTNKNVTSVFTSLGSYDKTKWRLFDYTAGDNREYPGFTTINTGKGYWLIARNTSTINPGEGTPVLVDDATPYTLNLSAGWNLIGNPYNFRISWDDVLAANTSVTGVGAKLKLFSAGALTDGTNLDRYRGAFVFSTNAVALKIPAIRNTLLGGRVGDDNEAMNSLDRPHWEVKLKLTNGELSNELGGIGMDPEATLKGKDVFDGVSVPLPDGLGLFEVGFSHPEFFASFNKEFVPTQANFTYEFSVKQPDESILDLSWTNTYFGNNEKQLILFDAATQQIVDMRKENHFQLSPATKKLKIFFGSNPYIQENLEKQVSWIGSPYPNPAHEELTIPFRVPEHYDEVPVSIKIYNSNGAEVASPVNQILSRGTYQAKWYPSGETGLYLVRMKIGNEEGSSIKIVLK